MNSDHKYIVYYGDMTRLKIKNNISVKVHDIIKKLKRKSYEEIIYDECVHFYDDNNQELIDNIIEAYSKLNKALYDQEGEYIDIIKI